MKNINQALATLVVLLLLAAIAVAGIAAFDYARTLYTSLDPQVARITATGLIAILTTAWIVARIARRAAAQRIRQQLGNEVAAAYQYFVDYWTAVMADRHHSDNNLEEPSTLDRLLALYGSAEVIKAHMRLRTMMQEREAQDGDVRAEFGKALVAMRNDLGFDMHGITAQQLQNLALPAPDAEARPIEMPQPKTESGPATGVQA